MQFKLHYSSFGIQNIKIVLEKNMSIYHWYFYASANWVVVGFDDGNVMIRKSNYRVYGKWKYIVVESIYNLFDRWNRNIKVVIYSNIYYIYMHIIPKILSILSHLQTILFRIC